MSDEKTYPARTIVKAIQHLRTMDLDDMLALDLIDMDRLIEVLPVQSYRVVLTNVGERVIGAIKIIRDYSRKGPYDTVTLGLAESKTLVDSAREGKRPVVLTTTDEGSARSMVEAFMGNGSTAHLIEVR